MAAERCFVSKARGTVIDVLRDGRTQCFGKTLEQCRGRYPDAEEMTLDDFCAWKASRQRTPITWQETTKGKFNQMLEILPPAAMFGGGFLVGEPMDHDAGNGRPRFEAYRQRGATFQVASRPLTLAEFTREIANP
jgi:hypothetical protein